MFLIQKKTKVDTERDPLIERLNIIQKFNSLDIICYFSVCLVSLSHSVSRILVIISHSVTNFK